MIPIETSFKNKLGGLLGPPNLFSYAYGFICF